MHCNVQDDTELASVGGEFPALSKRVSNAMFRMTHVWVSHLSPPPLQSKVSRMIKLEMPMVIYTNFINLQDMI